MARDRGPPVLRQPAVAPRSAAAAFPAEARGWGWLGAGLWPALLVGLLAAVVAWFWYGSGDGRRGEGGEAAPVRGGREGTRQASGEAAATGTGRGCCGSGAPRVSGCPSLTGVCCWELPGFILV